MKYTLLKDRKDNECPCSRCKNHFYISGGKCYTCGYDPRK